jgi:hypothetical protein
MWNATMNEVVTQTIGCVNVLSPLKKPDIRIFPLYLFDGEGICRTSVAG